MIHKTVLLNEVIEKLNLKKGAVYFDGTLGGAGHSLKICSDFGNNVRIIAVDKDISAIKNAQEKFSKLNCQTDFILSDFRDLDIVLTNLNIKKVDGILFDLGLSSDQLENSNRGFTFKNNESLLMTFSENKQKVNAKIILNNWSEETIADILFGYSDEKYSRKIAKAIVLARKIKTIKTTFDLIEIIKNAVPRNYQKGKIHFATKTFQSLRIAVNDEITALKEGMEKGWGFLKNGGRIAIISFHSVEDREVKNFFKDKVKKGEGKLINKKPIISSEKERKENPRSRSAKLRVIEKIGSRF
ncbi:MAG: 16S rRNA (cytosine(1402)-N(4))-methyltransferase RsmH [bacterium]